MTPDSITPDLLCAQDPASSAIHARPGLWALGYLTRRCRESKSAGPARQLDHPFSLAFALYFGRGLSVPPGVARVHSLQKPDGALGRPGFAQRLAQARIMLGWTLVEQGQVAEDCADTPEHGRVWGDGIDLGGHPTSSCWRGRTARRAGRGRVNCLDSAMTAVHRNRSVSTRRDHRLKGELRCSRPWGATHRRGRRRRLKPAASSPRRSASSGGEVSSCGPP
jgi:hypothetical protein